MPKITQQGVYKRELKSLRFRSDQAEAIQQLAEREGVTFTDMVELLIDAALPSYRSIASRLSRVEDQVGKLVKCATGSTTSK